MTPKQERFYVYALVDPRDDHIFYVGKGTGRRYAAHLAEWRCGRVLNAAKFEAIASIVSAGLEPRVEFLKRDLSENEAFQLERDIIRDIGVANLTNVARGQQTEWEKTVTRARDLLSRLIPWESMPVATRTEWRYAIYCGIKSALEALAAGRWPDDDVFAQSSVS